MRRDVILAQAVDLTSGQRDKVYGAPFQNHDRIAQIWSVILETEVTAAQVALCMAGLKLARLVNSPTHLDSYVDGAAYFAIAGEIANAK